MDSEGPEGSEGASIASPELTQIIAGLLAVTPQELEKAMCFRVIASRRDVVEKQHSSEQAYYSRNAFAKAIYERLFAWIVKYMNKRLYFNPTPRTDNTVIGVLDIYGFEIFDNNR